MSTLLILSKAPNRQNRSFMDRVLGSGDAIACIQDGVYYTRPSEPKKDVPIHALKDDLAARGLAAAENMIDYAGLVDLTFKYDRVVTI